jgi:hypothetical protein
LKVLLAGWFSFEQMGASAGDLLCRDLVHDWLRNVGIDVIVASTPPFSGDVSWRSVPADAVDAVVFACGPFGNGWPVPEFLAHFARRPLVGVNLTMLRPLEEWNPFDVLLERDSSRQCRPDAVFLADPRRVPVAGLVFVHAQQEYGSKGLHDAANGALRQLARANGLATIEIDSRLDVNAYGHTTPDQIESLISRVDVVLTTRLHGMVLALKNGVPSVVIDPIIGGAKILRQASAIGWQHAIAMDQCDSQWLQNALRACLSPSGRTEALSTAARARAQLTTLQSELVSALAAHAGSQTVDVLPGAKLSLGRAWRE